MADNKDSKTTKKSDAPKANKPGSQKPESAKPDTTPTPNALGMAIGGLLAPMLVAANGGNKCELPNINIWVFCNSK